MNKGLGYVQHGPPMPGLEEDVSPELRDKVHPVSPAPEGYVWISEECKHGKKLGEELEVSLGFGVSIDRSVALILFRGDYLKGRLLRVEDVPSYVEELKSRYKTRSVLVLPRIWQTEMSQPTSRRPQTRKPLRMPGFWK